jgi:hypothetical protein
MAAAIVCFALSTAGDLASLRAEEWFELVAGLFVATGVVALMHRHLKTNLQVRVRAVGAGARHERFAGEPVREPILTR